MKASLPLIEKLFCSALQTLRPPEAITVSQWAERYRQVSAGVSSLPGKWRNANAPYLAEIMDCFTDDDIREVVVMKAARMGITEAINNAICYFVDNDPCQMLYIQQTVELGETYSKEILRPLLLDNPRVGRKIGEKKARSSNETILKKNFPGGNLSIVGANSPRGLRMVAKRVVIADDLDGFEIDAGGEGDPFELAKKRAATFWNRKIVAVSSPTQKDISRIAALFEESDQRYYYVPCPECGVFQRLVFAQLRFKDCETHYECEGCKSKIFEDQKGDMLLKARWRPTAESAVAGFHISELYSLFTTWDELANNFLKAKRSSFTLKTFVNTTFGEAYEDEGQTVNEGVIFNRRENYSAEPVPLAAGVITAAADIQDDRIELEVVAWGKGYESWSLEYQVFYGNPAQDELWQRLDDALLKEYEHESGTLLRIVGACIDTGGHYTNEAYRFCKRRWSRGVFAIKGQSGAGKPIVISRSKKNKGRVWLYSLGVDTIKALHYSRLGIVEHGPGYCHFPTRYTREYFEGLTAEKAITKYFKGFKRIEWHLPPGKRNEPLDLRVYNIAALDILKVNLKRSVERLQPKVEGEDGKKAGDARETSENDKPEGYENLAQPGRKRKKKRKSRGGFVKRY